MKTISINGEPTNLNGNGIIKVSGNVEFDLNRKHIKAETVASGVPGRLAKTFDTISQTDSLTELAADIMEFGITLTGGGAHLRGLNQLITAETGMPVNIASEPLNCVVLGTGMVLEEIDKLKNVLISPRKALF